MRIVAVADTHTFQADLGAIPEGDVFVHAGDLLRRGTLDELRGVAEWIRTLPHRVKLVVAGNHDWCFVHDRAAAVAVLGLEIVYLQDSATTIDGLVFWGSPWQPEYNDWAFNLPRGEALRHKWHAIPPETDVLITHGPPRGFGDCSEVEGRAGCDDLLDAVRRVQPALHLFGHIHQDGGFWRDGNVALANVTTWECERGATVIDVDLTTKAVSDAVIPPRASQEAPKPR
jgi:Icc-related predicted phosphoesterase